MPIDESPMIDSASTMDRPVAKARGLSRRTILLCIAGGVLLLAAILALPTVRRWSRAELVVDGSRIRTGIAVRGDLERDVSAQGRIVAALHPTLFAPAQGIVTLAVKSGAQAKKGQPLARIDSPELHSRLTQERATLGSLEADLGRQQIAVRQAGLRSRQNIDLLEVRSAAAGRAMERAQRSLDEGLINRTEYEKAQDDAHIAEMDLANARSAVNLEKETLEFEVRTRALDVDRGRQALAELQRQVDELTIVAPFDGMVANVAVQDRDAVVRGQPVLTLVDLSAFEIEIDVPENYGREVPAGTPAEIVYEGRTYEGKVTTMSPEIRDSQVRGTVTFVGEPPSGLRQSQRVTTRIVLERRSNILKVPRGPFLESGGGRQAWVVSEGMASLREIQVGATSVSEVEISRGLEPGETIVLSDTTLFGGAKTVLLRN